jgi:UDP-glucuronate 4-epimerase
VVAERFLVTGALGCVGSWTVRVLREAGHDVVALNRGLGLERLRLVMERDDLADITFERCDITDRDAVEDVFERHEPTRVVHLAALQIPFCRADPSRGAQVNVQGTVNIFEAVRTRSEQIGMLVYSGSAAMYSPADAEAVARDEDAAPHPQTHYGVFKWANESTAKVYWREHGVASIGLRPMVVFGPGRDQGLTSASTMAMRAAALGEEFEIPHGGSSLFNYAPDAARMFVAAACTRLDGALTFNMPGSAVSVEDVVSAIRYSVVDAKVGYAGEPLPFPSTFATGGYTDVAPVTVTPFADAVDATIKHFLRAVG